MPRPPTPPPTTMAVWRSPDFAPADGAVGSAMLARTGADARRATTLRERGVRHAAGAAGRIKDVIANISRVV